jgi:FMN phosphatase YigB (HAD superfamily)
VSRTTFLLDVDNTLLDNDAVVEDLRRHLITAFGEDCQRRYWVIFEELRRQLGYADYLGALQRFRAENPRDPHMIQISLYLYHYPFADRLFPGTLDVIRRLSSQGRVVILSDGDVVFQPRKVERSGLWAAVAGEVLIYIHKEQMLDDVQQRYPADHYVVVDDKVRILEAIKRVWKDRVTTVFVRQGHYALDSAAVAASDTPDLTMERIGDLQSLDVNDYVRR